MNVVLFEPKVAHGEVWVAYDEHEACELEKEESDRDPNRPVSPKAGPVVSREMVIAVPEYTLRPEIRTGEEKIGTTAVVKISHTAFHGFDARHTHPMIHAVAPVRLAPVQVTRNLRPALVACCVAEI